MKKTLAIALIIAVITSLLIPTACSAEPAEVKLFITEVCFDASNKNSSDYFDYIEAVNLSGNAIDVRGGTLVYDDVSVNNILTLAQNPVQADEALVFVVYGKGEYKDGLTYDTDEGIRAILSAFNNKYGSSIDEDHFFLLPHYESGVNTVIDGTFSLTKEGTHSIAIKNAGGETLSVPMSYDATKYDKGGYSISFSLLDDGTSHLLGLTEADPGTLIPSRYTARDVNLYPETIRFMEYNVLALGGNVDPEDVVEDECLLISNRSIKVFEIINNYNPDVLVMTEFNMTWWNTFQSFLSGDGSKYTAVGYSDRNHNHTQMNGLWDSTKIILFNHDKYDLMAEGHFFVNQKPDSFGWFLPPDIQMHAPVCFNWAKLRDKTTGAEFGVLAIHPHASVQALYDLNEAKYPGLDRSKFGDIVRSYTADLVIKYLNENIVRDVPFIISGDFNSMEKTEAFDKYIAAGFEDSRNIDRNAIYISSCPGLDDETKAAADPDYLYKGCPIDHILLSKGNFTADSYRVVTDKLTEKYFPSDHLSVQAVLHLKPTVGDKFALTDSSSYTKDDEYVYMRDLEQARTNMVKNFKSMYRLDTDVSDIVGTGKKIFDKYDENDFRTFVVRGDLSGDGKLTSGDYLKLRQYFKGGTLTPAQEKAGDYDENGSIVSTDYLKLKSYFKGL